MVVLPVLVVALFARLGRAEAQLGETLVAQRPDLGSYQHATKLQCMYPGSTWYLMYRNTKGGDLGSDDRCLTDTQTTEVVDGKARSIYRFGAEHQRNATLTFKSPPGQVHKNVFEGKLDGAPEGKAAVYDVLYADCHSCKVLKRQESSKCVLMVREAALRTDAQHCHFLYDLLCGPSPKYNVSDASCLEGAKKG